MFFFSKTGQTLQCHKLVLDGQSTLPSDRAIPGNRASRFEIISSEKLCVYLEARHGPSHSPTSTKLGCSHEPRTIPSGVYLYIERLPYIERRSASNLGSQHRESNALPIELQDVLSWMTCRRGTARCICDITPDKRKLRKPKQAFGGCQECVERNGDYFNGSVLCTQRKAVLRSSRRQSPRFRKA